MNLECVGLELVIGARFLLRCLEFDTFFQKVPLSSYRILPGRSLSSRSRWKMLSLCRRLSFFLTLRIREELASLSTSSSFNSVCKEQIAEKNLQRITQPFLIPLEEVFPESFSACLADLSISSASCVCIRSITSWSEVMRFVASSRVWRVGIKVS